PRAAPPGRRAAPHALWSPSLCPHRSPGRHGPPAMGCKIGASRPRHHGGSDTDPAISDIRPRRTAPVDSAAQLGKFAARQLPPLRSRTLSIAARARFPIRRPSTRGRLRVLAIALATAGGVAPAHAEGGGATKLSVATYNVQFVTPDLPF